MGAVYEAQDVRLNRIVALKETLAETAELRRAFEREAHLLANLRHAALPKVLDHFEEEGGLFLVMEFIPGEDFGRMLEENRPFNQEEVLRWAAQLLDALEYLHAHEPPIIHRDIKPSNLKLLSPSQIVLLDFGIAKGAAGEMLRQTRSVQGYSPVYSPLEQMQGETTDARSDLYSLAATLYHILTGARPPDALTRATALVNGRADPLAPARELVESVSQTVSEALARAMSLEVEGRPASAAEMLQDLRGASVRASFATVPILVTKDEDATRIAQTRKRSAPSVRAVSSAAPHDDARKRRRRLVVPAPSDDESRRRSGARWSVLALVALVAFLSAAFVFLFLNSNRENAGTNASGRNAATAEASPSNNSDSTTDANVQATPEREPTPSPAELASRRALAQRGYFYDEESFARAVREGDSQAVELFMAAGMSPDALSADGRPAILNAATRGDARMTRTLLLGGASPDARDASGSTALMEAARRANKEVVASLLDNGADVNLSDRDGRTALMRAAAEGHDDLVRALLERGARASLKDALGRDAEALAEANGHTDTARLLKSARGPR